MFCVLFISSYYYYYYYYLDLDWTNGTDGTVQIIWTDWIQDGELADSIYRMGLKLD